MPPEFSREAESTPQQTGIALDARLRAELGRQLVIVVLTPDAEVQRETLAIFAASCAAYSEVRLIIAELAESAAPETLETTFRQAIQHDPDALLIWRAASGPLEEMADSERQWHRMLLDAADHVGLFDRALLALLGADVARASARALGYEDGFTSTQPLAEMLDALARDALTREAYHRRGSSPPCYL